MYIYIIYDIAKNVNGFSNGQISTKYCIFPVFVLQLAYLSELNSKNERRNNNAAKKTAETYKDTYYRKWI